MAWRDWRKWFRIPDAWKRQNVAGRRAEKDAARRLRVDKRKADLEPEEGEESLPDFDVNRDEPSSMEDLGGGMGEVEDVSPPESAWTQGEDEPGTPPSVPTIDIRRDEGPEPPLAPTLPGNGSVGFDIPRGPESQDTTEDPSVDVPRADQSAEPPPADPVARPPDVESPDLDSPPPPESVTASGPGPPSTIPSTPPPQVSPGVQHTEVFPGIDGVPDIGETEPPIDDTRRRAPSPGVDQPFSSQDLDDTELDIEGTMGAGVDGAGGMSPSDDPFGRPKTAEVPPPLVPPFGGVNPDPGMSPEGEDQFRALQEAMGPAQGGDQGDGDSQQILGAIESLREIVEEHGSILERLEEKMDELSDKVENTGGVGP